MGTEKCLVVIDTEKNMLVQVIGSEKKLLSEFRETKLIFYCYFAELCLGSDRDISGCRYACCGSWGKAHNAN